MLVDALSKEQILQLLSVAHKANKAHWLMILVGYLHGLRASEVVGIKRHDIKDGFLTVQRGKRSERTTQQLLMHPNALLSEREPLIAFAAKANPVHPLFNVTRQTFCNIIHRYGEVAGIPVHQCHPHILKHSCGTHIYEKTKSLPAVQKWLGHVSGSSTLIYLRMSQATAAMAVRDALGCT